ncbi:undecaprenyl/decaprenyl-phosphate alpha-N-acetylglucosaminyl 1-phosphate transferase [Candidatus Peregrinibacteria bacterium]|nr:undecaprenyl/decaprenyl-phosphate alpha-N-acetylglucosaminyl 1-phosphate transferase [Candidatus Peregrinibacteria bacterium]
MPSLYVFIAVTVFILTFSLTFFALRLFPKFGLVDRPAKYGLKRKPIPYYGGLVIFLSFFLSVFIFLGFDWRLVGLVIASFFIVVVSFFDDYRDLSPYFRFVAQVIASLILVGFGIFIAEVRNPFGGILALNHYLLSFPFGPFSVSILSIALTVFWVVFITNTVNFLDGLNGLASGVSSIGFFILFVLSIKPAFHTIDQSVFAVLSLILAVIAFTFVLFEFAPAKILMGDTGSMFLGFMLAVLSIFSGGKIATAFLVLGFPILDAVWVIFRRILSGNSPFRGDLQHLHHRFLKAGFTERQALLFLYLLSTLFGSVALFLETFGKIIALFILVIFMLIVGSFLIVRARTRQHN